MRIALIQSLGNRRIKAAVPSLAEILHDSDTALSGAAAVALGQIGDSEAARALERAPDRAAATVVEARIRISRNLGGPEAQKTLEELFGDPSVAPSLRASALSALLFLEPDTVPQRSIASILGGDDRFMKQSVIAGLVGFPRSAVLPVVSAKFTSWDLETQTGVVAALGRMADPSALAIVLGAARSDREILRHTAIVSLGEMPGNGEVALFLAQEAHRPGEAGSVAKESLSKLTGAGVNDVVLSGAGRKGEPLRPVFLEELALRDTEGAAAILMAMRSDTDVALRCIALDGLELVCTSDLETPLLNWMVSSTDPKEQTHALRAAAAAAYRNPDEKARLKPVSDLLDGATPGVQRRLLTTLSRVGGSEAAAYVAHFALDRNGPAAEAAIEALGHWSDKTGLEPLASFAEKTSNENLRASAIDAEIISLPQSYWELSKDDKAIIARLKMLTKDAKLLGRLDALEKPPAS